MSDISVKVEEVLSGKQQALKNQPGIIQMQELYLKLLHSGVISKPEYDLPLLDTVGCKVGGPIRLQRHSTSGK